MSTFSRRLAAFATIATLGLAPALTYAQMGDPTAPNAPGEPAGRGGPGGEDRGPGGPGMGRGPGGGGMRGGPAGAMLAETFGATVRPLPRDQAKGDVKPGVGLSVENVKPDSLAAKSGLKDGDLLIKLGDQWVINPPQLGTLLSIQDVDASVKLTVLRGGEKVEIDLKVDQAAHDAMTKALDAAPNRGPGGPDGERGPGGGRGRNGGGPRPPAGGEAPTGGNP